MTGNPRTIVFAFVLLLAGQANASAFTVRWPFDTLQNKYDSVWLEGPIQFGIDGIADADFGQSMQSSGDQPPASMESQPMQESGVPMKMNSYFSSINYPIPSATLMVMFLSDYQAARYTRNFLTGMVMAQYGITSRWTAGIMAEGQKIVGQPITYGGMRFNTYFHVFSSDRLFNITVYGEYEELNGAALYKMEVAGFGGEDLEGSLHIARHTPVRTFEQRVIFYHDWDRKNVTLNLISETGITHSGNDFGYSVGIFRQPQWTGMSTGGKMGDMEGMNDDTAPPILSLRRLGFGLEAMGALGNDQQFGLYWSREQQYAGPLIRYALSMSWTAQLELALGLSDVSDPSVLRFGLGYSIAQFAGRSGR
jgi:hypothetical protein